MENGKIGGIRTLKPLNRLSHCGQKPQFWANVDFWGLLYRPPITDEGQIFGVLKQTDRLHLQAEFYLNVFIVSPSGGQKTQFWANFEFWGSPVPAPFYR